MGEYEILKSYTVGSTYSGMFGTLMGSYTHFDPGGRAFLVATDGDSTMYYQGWLDQATLYYFQNKTTGSVEADLSKQYEAVLDATVLGAWPFDF